MIPKLILRIAVFIELRPHWHHDVNSPLRFDWNPFSLSLLNRDRLHDCAEGWSTFCNVIMRGKLVLGKTSDD